MAHTCEALVLTCMDFRFHTGIRKFLTQELGLENSYDQVSLAGSAKDLVRTPGHVPFESLLKQMELSSKLHEIKKVILINHQNCGAYGPSLESGTSHEFETHAGDLRSARSLIQSRFPGLKVLLFFAKLDGTFTEVP
jgi:carbonic anhydrase